MYLPDIKVHFVGLLIFFSIMLFGQEQPKVDDLINKSAKAMNNLDTKSMVKHASEAFVLSEKSNYSKGKVNSALLISQALFAVGQYPDALEYLAKCEKENFFRKNKHVKAEYFRIRGRIYIAMEQYDKAFVNFHKALYYTKLSKKETRDFLLPLAYENLSVIHLNLKRSDSVVYYLEKSKNFISENSETNIFNKINLYTNYGLYYSDIDENEKANSSFKAADSLATLHGNVYKSYNYKNWGNLAFKLKDYKQAERYYLLAEKELATTHLEFEQNALYQSFIELYLATNEVEKEKNYKIKFAEQNLKIQKNRNETLSILTNELDHLSLEKPNYKVYNVIVLVGFGLLIAGVLLYYYSQSKKKSKTILENENSRKLLTKKLNGAFNELGDLAKKNDPLLSSRFKEVYPEIVEFLLTKDPKLRTSELRLFAFIFLGFTTKQIAQIKNRSISTIANRKYNLKKKLNISQEQTFESWIEQIDNN